jgi:hypothetical protein
MSLLRRTGQLPARHRQRRKSYVALFVSKDILDDGGHVVWPDWEDPDEVTILNRLPDLGVTPDAILERSIT